MIDIDSLEETEAHLRRVLLTKARDMAPGDGADWSDVRLVRLLGEPTPSRMGWRRRTAVVAAAAAVVIGAAAVVAGERGETPEVAQWAAAGTGSEADAPTVAWTVSVERPRDHPGYGSGQLSVHWLPGAVAPEDFRAAGEVITIGGRPGLYQREGGAQAVGIDLDGGFLLVNSTVPTITKEQLLEVAAGVRFASGAHPIELSVIPEGFEISDSARSGG